MTDPVIVNFSWGHILVLIAIPVIASILLGWLKIPTRLTTLEADVKNLKEWVKPIYEKFINRQFSTTNSPKQITDIGKHLLKKHNVSDFLKDCHLMKSIDQMKTQKELDIFISCLEWVDQNGKKKITEIMYENDISKEQCQELLALALRDEILNKINHP